MECVCIECVFEGVKCVALDGSEPWGLGIDCGYELTDDQGQVEVTFSLIFPPVLCGCR